MTEQRSDVEPDPLYEEALRIVLTTRKASVSWVQRHLKIGYNRTARMIELMEEAGIVSPPEPGGGREVYGAAPAACEALKVQACRPEDRAMLATPAGQELLGAVATHLAGEAEVVGKESAAILALRNCLALASRHRNEPWAVHIRRFCAEGGVTSSPLRSGDGS